jgi:hypothetical protein
LWEIYFKLNFTYSDDQVDSIFSEAFQIEIGDSLTRDARFDNSTFIVNEAEPTQKYDNFVAALSSTTGGIRYRIMSRE